MKKCHFCGCEDSANDRLMEEGYYDDVYLCMDCWMSEEVNSWRKQKEAEDAGYRRYMELITANFEISCPQCNTVTYRDPKFIGHSASWELCCTECANVDYQGVSPYKYDLSAWQDAYTAYMKGHYDLKARWQELEAMEKALGLPVKKCSCGGEFSMLAMPRCRQCGSVVMESVFHICDDGEDLE